MGIPSKTAPPVTRAMMIKGGNDPVKIVMEIGGLALGAFLVYEGFQLVKKYNDKADLKRDQDSTIKPGKNGKLFDLNGKPITGVNLATIATDLDNALSFPADQARAVRVFKSTPFGYVKKLEDLFLAKNFGNLRQRMADKLSDANWIKVKFYFE